MKSARRGRRRNRAELAQEKRPAVADPVAGSWRLRGWEQRLVGSAWLPALLGALLLWASLPPLHCDLLVWVAPLPWLVLIAMPKLLGRRPYIVLYFAGFVFWLAALHWLRLPHWTTALGWVALAIYLAVYLPAFVGLSRVAVHKARIPLPLAAAGVWVGLDVLRAHLLTGFSMAAIAHALYRQPLWIQAADLIGEQGLGGVIVAVAACLLCVFRPKTTPRRRGLALASGVALVGALAGYGHWRMADVAENNRQPAWQVALVQGSVDITLDGGPGKRLAIHRHYLDLTRQGLAGDVQPDLIVWPETVYGGFLYDADADPAPPPGWDGDRDSFAEHYRALREESEAQLAQFANTMDCSLLLGAETVHFGRRGVRFYNSAVFVVPEPDGLRDSACQGRYDKRHLVLFGEYIPWADWFPWLQGLSPLSTSTTPGTRAVAFDVPRPRHEARSGAAPVLRVAPNICYESVLSRVIRRQVLELRREGQEPHVLVNLTNDGWFWGSSELDMHLACGVFRAVECRKPFLIAANTGFSASIAPTGAIRRQGPRRDTEVLLVDVQRNTSEAFYTSYGWVVSGMALLFVAALAAGGVASRGSAPSRLLTRRGSRGAEAPDGKG